jgi:hypothetical protein
VRRWSYPAVAVACLLACVAAYLLAGLWVTAPAVAASVLVLVVFGRWAFADRPVAGGYVESERTYW